MLNCKPKTLNDDWAKILKEEFSKKYFEDLVRLLKSEISKFIIYPPKEEMFSAFNLTSYKNTRVVILGQDPYHGKNQAHGLSFSVQKGIRKPPSLRNIFKELNNDLGITEPEHGCLISWAKQGILLLNTTLTVREKDANSHSKLGWEQFTDSVIKKLNNKEHPVVFVLWGKHAQEKEKLIESKKHLILKSAHPSPFSAHRGFLGSKPFSRINQFLQQNSLEEIDWSLPT